MKQSWSRSAPGVLASPGPYISQIFYGIGMILIILVFSGLVERDVTLARYLQSSGTAVTVSLDTAGFFSPLFLSLGLVASAWPDFLLQRRRSFGFAVAAAAVITTLQTASHVPGELAVVPVLLILFRAFALQGNTLLLFPLVGWMSGALSEVTSVVVSSVGGPSLPASYSLGGGGVLDPILVDFLLGLIAFVVLILLIRWRSRSTEV